MKKAILLLCLAAGLVSCAKEAHNPENENAQAEGIPMTFDVTVLETKAAKTAWADGDKIYVFFNGLETKYLVMTYSTSTGWSDASGGGDLLDTDFSGLGTKKLTAVHFPVAVDVTFADGKFSFTSGGKPVYNYYLFETGKDYTVDGTTITATLSMGKPADMVQIHVAGIQGSVADYTFGCTKIKPVACASINTAGEIIPSELQAGARLSGVADADGGIFAGRLVYPGEEKDYTFTVASDSHIYTLTRTGENKKALTAGKMYNFPSLSTTGGTNWTVTDVSDLYVDLGLSVKWAKYNVGATTETDYGNYFAWGEVTGYNEGKTNFASDWSHYYFGTSSSFSKYTGSDYETLEKDDDAAYAALGGKFRMPTKVEIDALLGLSKEWVTNYNGSGIAGYKFTGTGSGSGNTLFLPAAGLRLDSDLYNDGSNGGYWSSSLITDYPSDAWFLVFYSGVAYTDYSYRCIGFPVRPVSE